MNKFLVYVSTKQAFDILLTVLAENDIDEKTNCEISISY